MRAVLPHSINMPRSVALMLLAATALAAGILALAWTASGVSPTATHVPRPPASVSLSSPTPLNANDSSPLFGPQP
jgi:hypothetical protein